jgi:hypothetical protein
MSDEQPTTFAVAIRGPPTKSPQPGKLSSGINMNIRALGIVNLLGIGARQILRRHGVAVDRPLVWTASTALFWVAPIWPWSTLC